MKYIDTRTHYSLMRGVIDFLNLTVDEMNHIFESMYYDSEREPRNWANSFLTKHPIDKPLEYIQMFHLSRRLVGTDLWVNDNLEQLLLKESPLSTFLKKYGITFKKKEDHIDILYKGEMQPLDDEFRYSGGNMYYLRSRLGYNTNQDYCVNGLAFRHHLEENYYYRALSLCPEFVQNIEALLDINGMSSDYYRNSKYYCIEYLVPLSEVIFDANYSPESDRDKTVEFLSQAIVRLYDDWWGSSFSGDQNLRLRLSDYATIKKEWFVCAEEL